MREYLGTPYHCKKFNIFLFDADVEDGNDGAIGSTHHCLLACHCYRGETMPELTPEERERIFREEDERRKSEDKVRRIRMGFPYDEDGTLLGGGTGVPGCSCFQFCAVTILTIIALLYLFLRFCIPKN